MAPMKQQKPRTRQKKLSINSGLAAPSHEKWWHCLSQLSACLSVIACHSVVTSPIHFSRHHFNALPATCPSCPHDLSPLPQSSVQTNCKHLPHPDVIDQDTLQVQFVYAIFRILHCCSQTPVRKPIKRFNTLHTNTVFKSKGFEDMATKITTDCRFWQPHCRL